MQCRIAPFLVAELQPGAGALPDSFALTDLAVCFSDSFSCGMSVILRYSAVQCLFRCAARRNRKILLRRRGKILFRIPAGNALYFARRLILPHQSVTGHVLGNFIPGF